MLMICPSNVQSPIPCRNASMHGEAKRTGACTWRRTLDAFDWRRADETARSNFEIEISSPPIHFRCKSHAMVYDSKLIESRKITVKLLHFLPAHLLIKDSSSGATIKLFCAHYSQGRSSFRVACLPSDHSHLRSRSDSYCSPSPTMCKCVQSA